MQHKTIMREYHNTNKKTQAHTTDIIVERPKYHTNSIKEPCMKQLCIKKKKSDLPFKEKKIN